MVVGPWGLNTRSTNASSEIPPATTSISAQMDELRPQAGHAATPDRISVVQNTVPDADSGASTPKSLASRYSVSASRNRPATSSADW